MVVHVNRAVASLDFILDIPGSRLQLVYFPFSVVPTLQPFEFLRHNSNIARTPVPVFVKCGFVTK
jgi:hypothetical protein